jgi:hypothetical protein
MNITSEDVQAVRDPSMTSKHEKCSGQLNVDGNIFCRDARRNSDSIAQMPADGAMR